MAAITDFYREYHVARNDERLALFQGLVARYAPRSALYPGSFVHITPSFVIPTVVYVDSDRRAARFFDGPSVRELVTLRKEFTDEPIIRFHAQNYEKPLDEQDASFDLLISQYAGFVSQACKRYLRIGGHLVANNSHADASMAGLDPDYELVAIYTRRGERFTITESDLSSYMVARKQPAPTRAELERAMRGPAFTRQAAGYIFELMARRATGQR